LYTVGWVLVGAVCGVLAFTMTALFAMAAAACFLIGFSIEKGWHSRLAARVPLELRSPIIRRRRDEVVIPPPNAPLGFLDFQLAFERALEALAKIAGRMAKDQKAGLRLNQSYTPRFLAAQKASTADQVALSREYAIRLAGHAEKMALREVALRDGAAQLSENGLERIRLFPPGIDSTMLHPFRDIIEGIRNPTVGARDATVEYRGSVAGMRKIGLQQSVNAVTDRLLGILERLIEDYDAIIGFGDAALLEIDLRRGSQSSTSPTISSQNQA
jgi:hypothetical protein